MPKQSYVDSTLTPGETVLYRGRISRWVYASAILFGLLALVTFGATLIIAIPAALWAWAKIATTELAVTSEKVVAKVGLIERQTIEQRLSRVDSISVKRVLGNKFGTVIIRGSGESITPIEFVHAPEEFRRQVELAILAQRNNVTAPPVPPAPDLADQLSRLAALRDQGVLTPEEFAAQKARLLA